MASCRVDLTPTALPPPCQLHKTHDGDDDNDDDYDTNELRLRKKRRFAFSL